MQKILKCIQTIVGDYSLIILTDGDLVNARFGRKYGYASNHLTSLGWKHTKERKTGLTKL